MSTHRLLFLNSTSRIRGYSVWESFVFILNGMVFFIIGLGLPEIVDGLRADGIPLPTAIKYGILVTGTLIAARIICSYGALITTMIFRPQVMPHSSNRRRRWTLPLLLGWTGMRGVVSLAAALAIPVALEDGTAFPHRHLILFITFMVILLTLLIQGLTLPYLIKRSHLFEITNDPSGEEARMKLLKGLKQHTYAHLKNKHENGTKDDAGLQKLMQHWEAKINAADDNWMNGQTKDHYLQMLESQRQFLVEQNKDLGVDEELIRLQLYQIDLEEERLRML
jgi:CPA1 family monovalent cation:H+ antiporter